MDIETPTAPPTKEEIAAFFKAIEVSDFDAVRKTVEARPDAVNWKHADGFAAMHFAILESHKSEPPNAIAFYLIDHGADLNSMQPIENGCPLVPFAISWNANEIALRLIEAGADLSWKSGYRAPLEGFPELEHLGGSTFLMSAAGAGAIDIAKALLARGADLNEKDLHGKTAVMLAAECGQGAMVEFLVSRGAALDGLTIEGHDIRALALEDYRKRAVPAVEEAFNRISEEASNMAHNGLNEPLQVSRIRLRKKNEFLRL